MSEAQIPIVHHDRFYLGKELYIRHWLYFPMLGTSILHSMERERAA